MAVLDVSPSITSKSKFFSVAQTNAAFHFFSGAFQQGVHIHYFGTRQIIQAQQKSIYITHTVAHLPFSVISGRAGLSVIKSGIKVIKVAFQNLSDSKRKNLRVHKDETIANLIA